VSDRGSERPPPGRSTITRDTRSALGLIVGLLALVLGPADALSQADAVPPIVINEIDYDQPGTDTAEFVEIKNIGNEAVSLGGVTLDLINGTGGGASIYRSIALPDVSLGAGAYFVICGDAANVPSCDLDVTPDTNLVQNGSPDAVALALDGEIIDSVSYEGDTGAPYTEGSGAGLEDSSGADALGISRFPDGADTDQNDVDFSARCITPGAANTAAASYCTNRPPVADAGEDQTVSADASCSATVVLDGTGSTDPDGDLLSYAWTGPFGTASGPTPTVMLPLGIHGVALTVDDGKGGTDSDVAIITVEDTMGPVIGAVSVTPDTLWPPNHEMQAVSVVVTAADACDPAAPMCQIVSVTSNEPIDGAGDGHTAPDWEVTGSLMLDLQAERSGHGDARIYTIEVECTDAAGNASSASAIVMVPHDRRKGRP
jgi:hypothetical protein